MADLPERVRAKVAYDVATLKSEGRLVFTGGEPFFKDLVEVILAFGAECYAEGKEAAAKIAEDHGFTFDENTEHQPWAKEANRALRIQNKAVAKKIRESK